MALAVVAAACGGVVASDAPRAAGPHDAPDRPLGGPQGDLGQFAVECGPSHLLADDPIVKPTEPGGSHLHQFFGSTGAATGATLAELTRGSTTCALAADTASYWTPALVGADGEIVEPLGMTGYYRAGPGVEPTSVVAYPPGFMMVAGDHAALTAQDLAVVAWSCNVSTDLSATPPDCTGTPSLRMSVTFPDCWDGEQIRSPIPSEPSLHVSYSSRGACPDEHPVAIPQLQLAVDFPPVPAADLDGLALSSGNILTGHADFWNTWDQAKLEREVSACLHRDLPCNVVG